MKRTKGRSASSLSFIALAGIVLSACSESAPGDGPVDASGDAAGPGLYVLDVLAEPTVNAGQACVFTNNPAQPSIGMGTLDIDFQTSYAAEFMVGNSLPAQGLSSGQGFDPATVNVQGVVVRITDASGNAVASFTEILGDTIEPAVDASVDYAPVPVALLSSTAGQISSIYDQVTTGGQNIRLTTYTTFLGKDARRGHGKLERIRVSDRRMPRLPHRLSGESDESRGARHDVQ